MKDAEIREKLAEKYIGPTRLERERFAGIEVEMPILNLDKKPVDFAVVHELERDFSEHFGFRTEGTDDEGNVYLSVDPRKKDRLSFDCSYNNLELSLGKVSDLNDAQRRFFIYYDYIQEALRRHHHTLTGMGINPYRYYNHNVPIPNGRYRMLFHHLHSYPRYTRVPMLFHPYPAFGTFSSASQVQLDVREEEGIFFLANEIGEELQCDVDAGVITIADWNRFFDMSLPLENQALGWKDTSTRFVRITAVDYEGEPETVVLDLGSYGIRIYADEEDLYLPVSVLSNMMTDIYFDAEKLDRMMNEWFEGQMETDLAA